VRFDFRSSLSTIDSPFAKVGNIIVGDYKFEHHHSNSNIGPHDDLLLVTEEEVAVEGNVANVDHRHNGANNMKKINCLDEYQFNVTSKERVDGAL
jgi:hypothetical protein